MAPSTGSKEQRHQSVQAWGTHLPVAFVLVALRCALVYGVTAELGHWLSLKPQSFATFWPANGFYLAALLQYPPARWPLLIVATMLGNGVSDLLHERSVAVMLGYSSANSLEVLGAALLVRHYLGTPVRLQNTREVLGFTALAAVLSPMLGALLGGVTTSLAYGAPFLLTWALWWSGDAVSMLMAAPLAFAVTAWSPRDVRQVHTAQGGELVLLLLSLIAVALMLAFEVFPFTYIALPVLLWAALRFGAPGVAGMLTVLAVMLARATATSHGPFADPAFSSAEKALYFHSFVGIYTFVGMVLGAVVTQRQQAQAALQQAHDTLEFQVAERTAALDASNRRLQREIQEHQHTEDTLRMREEQYRLALDAAELGTWVHDLDTDCVHQDLRSSRQFGLEALVTPIAQIIARIHPEDRPWMAQHLAAIRTLPEQTSRFTVEYRIGLSDQPLRWMHVQAYLTFAGEGAARRPTHVVGTSQDITARKQADEALRQSDERLRLATQTAALGIWEWHLPTNQLRWDAQMFRIYQVAPTPSGVVPYTTWSHAVVPEELPQQEALLQDTIRRGGTRTRTFRIRRAGDGATRHIEAVETVRANAQGQAEWVVGTNLDVTERVQAAAQLRQFAVTLEQRVVERTAALRQEIAERQRLADDLRLLVAEKDLLLKEIHHRVKNNMQVISSILQLQAGSSSDPQWQGLLNECHNRVRTMALIHQQLYDSPTLTTIDSRVYISELVEMLGYSYRQPHIRWQTDLEAIALDLDTAIPLGLILNELVSNVYKHAFPEAHPGTLTVQLHQQDAQTACLMVQDDGVGLPVDLPWAMAPSLGLQIMQALARQLRGSLEVDRAGGTTVRLVFPLPVATA